jgi:GT2 family glycosyltransferase
MIEVSILITTFNSRRFIRPCLDSILAQGPGDTEIIVVDNGSSDETVSLLRRNYPAVKLIANKENLGACRGRNQAIAAASGKWILALDCDVVLENDFIVALLTCVRDLDGRVGILQPKILAADKKRIYSCGIYLSWFRRIFDIGKGCGDTARFDRMGYIFGACSAAAIYKRKMLDEIRDKHGYFDERFFFLVEDVDLAWRAQRNGWKALFCPPAVCYHHGNSCGFAKKIRQYLCWRNRYYAIIKNEGWKEYCLRILPFLFYDLPRLFYLVLTNRYITRGNAVRQDYPPD